MANDPHILAADDNELNRKIIRRQLDKLGYACDVVAGGAEAVTACERRRYNLVFMDVQMSGMDGFQATEAIRDRTGHPRVPIIAITAHDAHDEMARCLDAGMNDFLPKPIRLGELATRLVRWGARPIAPPDPGRAGDSAELPVLAAGAVDRLDELERASGHAHLAAEIIEDFSERMPARMRRLNKALARGNSTRVAQECFALQMFSRGLGALRLEAVVAALAGATAADERARLAAAAEREVAAVIDALGDARGAARRS